MDGASDEKPAGAPISRRRFLRRTLAGAALVAVGGALARNLSGYDTPEHRNDPALAGLRVLSRKEAIIFRAAARRLLAPDGAGAPSPDAIDVVRAADTYLAALPD